ncbi:MAG: heparan-alpha-glucosaminide N-acetyltransferase domain-containing protein, partial [Natronospirillum sp.]
MADLKIFTGVERLENPTARTPMPRVLALLLQTPVQPARVTRIHSVDLARGIAVALMILSHGVVGLLPFDDFASYGQIPIHLITKFASSTFVLVFGIALAVSVLPKVG